MSIEKCYGQFKRRFPKLNPAFKFKNPSVYNVCKRNYDEEIREDANYWEDVFIGEIVNDNGPRKRDAISRSFII